MRSIAMRVALHVFFLVRSLRFRLTQPRPRRDRAIHIEGADTIRILVVGAGVAAAYGVHSHSRGLAGQLAREVARRSRRGVLVQTRAVPIMPARRTLQVVGRAGADGYDAVVLAGCYLEARLAPDRSHSRHVEGAIRHLLSTGPGHLSVIVTGLPRPAGRSRLDVATAHAVTVSNWAAKDACEHHDRVAFVPLPSYGSLLDRRPFDEQFYTAAAQSIADDGLWHLGV